MTIFVPDDVAFGAPSPTYDPAELVRTRRAWGMEALVDMFDCDLHLIDDIGHIAVFAVDLCKRIGMQAYGPPQVPVFGLADPKTSGPSLVEIGWRPLKPPPPGQPMLVQLIQTSMISAHFARHWAGGFVALNIHSCAAFDADAAAEFARDRFRADSMSVRVFARGVRLPEGT